MYLVVKSGEKKSADDIGEKCGLVLFSNLCLFLF